MRRKARNRMRSHNRIERIIEEETVVDLQSPRTWRLVQVSPESTLTDILDECDPRIAFIAYGQNPALLDKEELRLAMKILEKSRTRLPSYIKGRVPGDFEERVIRTMQLALEVPEKFV